MLILFMIVIFITSLLFRFLKPKKNENKNAQTKESIENMSNYGIEVNGIDITKNKIYSVKEKIDVIAGQSFTRQLDNGEYFTVEEVYDFEFYRSWWGLKRNNNINCHIINLNGNIMSVNWTNTKANSPYKISSVTIWGG